MSINETFFTISDINGAALYSGAEGNTKSQSSPAVPRSAPFTYDCDSAQLAASANADLVTAVSGKKLRVLSIVLSADSACSITIQSGATTDLFGPIYLSGDSSQSLSCETGLFEGVAGEKLNVVLSGSANYSVSCRYREV